MAACVVEKVNRNLVAVGFGFWFLSKGFRQFMNRSGFRNIVVLLAAISAIATFILMLFAYLRLSPTLVELRPEPVPVLSGFAAYEYVNDPYSDDAEYLDAISGPVVWIEGYIANDGTALASDLALEIGIQEPVEDSYGRQVRPVTEKLLGIVGGSDAYNSELAQIIPWASRESFNAYRLANMHGWSRLYLPPISAGSYIQVLVGLPATYSKDLTIIKVRHAVSQGVSLRLVRMTKPTQARSSYGEEVPGEPELLDELHLRFKNVFEDWHGV